MAPTEPRGRGSAGTLSLLIVVLVLTVSAVASATETSVSSETLIQPFETPDLAAALEHTRRHLIRENTADRVTRDHLGSARDALDAALDKGIDTDELAATTLLTARILKLEGNATAAASVFAVSAMLMPSISPELQTLSAGELRRTGPLPAGVPIPQTEPDSAFATLNLRLRADRLAVRSPEEAADMLDGALTGGRDTLCSDGLALLPRLVLGTPQYNALLAAMRAGCAAAPEGRVAAVIAASLGGLSLSTQQRLQMARRYYLHVEHDAVLQSLAPLLDDRTISTPERCEALWRTAMTYRRSRRASQSAPVYQRMDPACASLPDWHSRAVYGIGWNQFRDGALDDADQTFIQLLSDYPHSRYADDALFYRMRIAVRQDDLQRARTLLDEILEGRVTGDMIGDAAWRYFDAALDAGQEIDADLALAVDALRDDRSYRSSGRLAWLQASRAEGADRTRLFEAILYDYPLSFAAYLAYSQLVEDGATEAISRWKETVATARKPTGVVYFQPVPDSDALRAARWWWAGGWSDVASRVISASGASDDMSLWLVALGYHLVGRYDLSHDIARRSIDGWRSVLPSPQHRLLWEIAYPLPYFQLVTDAAAQANIQPALVWAIMREESGFRPRVESYAHAIGLMQLLVSTGASHAKRAFGWDLDGEDLKDPQRNIPVGAAFLGHLARKLQPNTVLMAAGYNAGRGAVNGWLKKRGALPLFRFTESIPYTQTRDYSKRVNASLFTYQLLYGSGDIVPLPLSLQ